MNPPLPKPLTDMRILAGPIDSPTLTTGFAKVGQNLFPEWVAAGATVDCWGIGYTGWDYDKVPYLRKLFPGGNAGDWHSQERFSLFLGQLLSGDYTHVFLLQDTFLLSMRNFPETLRKVCWQKKIRSCLYFPVDAPLDPEWSDIIAAVDVPVAYTDYGKGEAVQALVRRAAMPDSKKLLDYFPKLNVLPHGVDPRVFKPLPNREELRKKLWNAGPNDFVMLNVNANQWRKDVARSLELLQALKLQMPTQSICLHMHMAENSLGPDNLAGISLDSVARQLELPRGCWGHADHFFRSGSARAKLTEAQLAEYYNAADLVISTSLGEGWGFSASESVGCGTPIALPEHTACQEIMSGLTARDRAFLGCRVPLPVEPYGLVQQMDNSRIRQRVNVDKSVPRLAAFIAAWKVKPPRVTLNDPCQAWLSWPRIAGRFLDLMNQTPMRPPVKDTLGEFGGLEVVKDEVAG